MVRPIFFNIFRIREHKFYYPKRFGIEGGGGGGGEGRGSMNLVALEETFTIFFVRK